MKKLLLLLALLTTLVTAQESKLTHIVLCWMDSTVSEESVDSLIIETKKLDEIPGVETLTVGRPVPSERPIVDDSFSFGITMTFASEETMNAYLSDERHTSFVGTHIKPRLAKLIVYDIVE